MAMEKIYSCNVCREEIKNPSESFGVKFTDMTNFTLEGYRCTDGVHICYDCARQLAEHLGKAEIKKHFNGTQSRGNYRYTVL
jgi:hypothetical protein